MWKLNTANGLCINAVADTNTWPESTNFVTLDQAKQIAKKLVNGSKLDLRGNTVCN